MSNTARSAAPLHFDDVQRLVAVDEVLAEASRRVASLDFSMLKSKLQSEYGWAAEQVDECEDLYRKFLALNIRYPERKICPTGPIDEFWHAHILDTRAYAADCDFLFGGLLHHFPYFGMRGPEDREDLDRTFRESVELFVLHYGIDPTFGEMEARKCRAQKCP